MMKALEQKDIRSLLELYIDESKEFSKALESGAAWKILQYRRGKVREIGELISKKYEEIYGRERTRHFDLYKG